MTSLSYYENVENVHKSRRLGRNNRRHSLVSGWRDLPTFFKPGENSQVPRYVADVSTMGAAITPTQSVMAGKRIIACDACRKQKVRYCTVSHSFDVTDEIRLSHVNGVQKKAYRVCDASETGYRSWRNSKSGVRIWSRRWPRCDRICTR